MALPCLAARTTNRVAEVPHLGSGSSPTIPKQGSRPPETPMIRMEIKASSYEPYGSNKRELDEAGQFVGRGRGPIAVTGGDQIEYQTSKCSQNHGG